MSKRLCAGRGSVKNRPGNLSHYERQTAGGCAEEKTEKQPEKETPFVGKDVAVKTSIRFPGDPNGFAKRELFVLGFILHTADAAGADSIERISITTVVEIWFIGLLASRGWKCCSG